MEKGDVEFKMGRNYLYGIAGLTQSYAAAIRNFKIAAEQGHAGAQIELALCYLYGEGVPEDKNEAVKWLLRAYNNPRATEENTKTAQQQLTKLNSLPSENAGMIFKRGVNCFNSQLSLAMECFFKSATQGYAEAQLRLGLCYKDGTGVPRCILEAEKWLKMASNNPDAFSEITEAAQEQLSNLNSIPLEKGAAEFEKGQCHYYGKESFEQSFKLAVMYYRMAAGQGHAEAQLELAFCYLYGEGVPGDKKEADKWFQRVCDNPSATEEIKNKAQEQINKRQDQEWLNYQTMIKLLEESAMQGSAKNQILLGNIYLKIYLDFDHSSQNKNEALKWFSKALYNKDATWKQRDIARENIAKLGNC